MKCPDDGAKITAKHYDPEFEWYECPKCEGCFTESELVPSRPPFVAKGKERRSEIAADEELADRMIEEMAKPRKKATGGPRHRDEISTRQVVNIMADEIQDVYHELGGQLDEANAHDKALTIWREVLSQSNVTAREQEVEMVKCSVHD